MTRSGTWKFQNWTVLKHCNSAEYCNMHYDFLWESNTSQLPEDFHGNSVDITVWRWIIFHRLETHHLNNILAYFIRQFLVNYSFI